MSTLSGVLLRHKRQRESWAVAELRVTAAGEGSAFTVGGRAEIVGGLLGMVQVGAANLQRTAWE